MDNPKAGAGRSRGRGRATNPQHPNNGGRGRRAGQNTGNQGAAGPATNQPAAQGAWGGAASRSTTSQPSAAQSSQGAVPKTPSGAWSQGPPASSAWSQGPPASSAWGQGPPPIAAARGRSTDFASKQPVFSAAAPQQQQRPPAPFAIGRAITHRETNVTEGQVVKEDTRGAVRGKRVIADYVRSRPQECVTKTGSLGDRIKVTSNYYRILKRPQWTIHQYRIDFSPSVDLLQLRRKYLYEHRAKFDGYLFDTDQMFSTKYLVPEMVNGVMELITKDAQGEPVQIKIKHVGIVDATDAQMLQILNLILRRAMQGLKMTLVQRNYFDDKAAIRLTAHKLEIWPGYQTSIRQHERDILLCCDIAHKVIREETMLQVISQAGNGKNHQENVKKLIVGMIIMTRYNNKTYRVSDVNFDLTPKSKFNTTRGDVSYVDYYKERYHTKIQDMNQPLLVSMPTERDRRGGKDQLILLIPELCVPTGLTDDMRSNFMLMRDMSNNTRLDPGVRIKRLEVFNRRLQQCQESVDLLRTWNVSLDTNLVEIPARVLPFQSIIFAKQNRYTCDSKADWSREFRNSGMYLNVHINRWIVVVERRFLREAQEFVSMCCKVARGMQLNIVTPMYLEIADDRMSSISQGTNDAAAKDPQLIMVVLSNNNEEKYNCVKKKCCVDRPVPSQVVTIRTIAPKGDKARGLMTIATKVVIQMNAKLMGCPWMIEVPVSGLLTIGFDVSHGGNSRNGYGALVACMDMKKKAMFYSTVKQHMATQEISDNMPLMVRYVLDVYKQEMGTLPAKIIFYRDGVGDGQLQYVVDAELNGLRKMLDSYYSQGPAHFAFIVVSKRINTRYFTNRENPTPGTVVDDIITLPERYDFFLVSQSVRQGTVSPTNYNVIYDKLGWNADKVQMLTYKMTHMYYNWAGTCRVPAVCQYAHKLAFLISENVKTNPSTKLDRSLYFL